MLSAQAEEANLEKTTPAFYQDVVLVEDPDSLSVLVNKNYSLPEDYEPEDLVFLEVPLYNNDVNNEANYLRKRSSRCIKRIIHSCPKRRL